MNYLLNTVEGTLMNLKKGSEVIITIKTVTNRDILVSSIIDYSDNFITIVKPNKEIVVLNINNIESMNFEIVTQENKNDIIEEEGLMYYNNTLAYQFFKGFAV